MDYKVILRALLETAYKIPGTEVDSLLDESKAEAEVQAAILAKDVARIQPYLQKFTEGQNKGKSEALTQLETAVKTKYGIESDAKGVELIDAVVAAKANPAIDEDKVKVHPAYRTLQESVNNMKTEHETALTTLKNGYEKQNQFAGLKDGVIWPTLTKAGYVMPANTNQANILKAQYEAELSKLDYEKQADGKVFVKENGEYKKDAHGNIIPLDVYATSLAANYFDVANNNGGASPKNGDAGNNGGTGGAKKFKDEAEFKAYITKDGISDADKNAAVTEYYGAKSQ